MKSNISAWVLKNLAVVALVFLAMASMSYSVTTHVETDRVTADYLDGNQTWEHQSYPAPSSTGYAVTGLGDIVTSTFFNIDGDKWMGDFNGMSYKLYNVSNVTVEGYFKGQPLDGSLGCGIISSAANNDGCGCITITDKGGLNVDVPQITVYMVNTSNDVVYCSYSATDLATQDDNHWVYYLDFDCNIQYSTFATYYDKDISPGDYCRIFDVKTHNGDIESVKGGSLSSLSNRKSRRLNVAIEHLKTATGMILDEDTFPYFNFTSGTYVYINSIVTAQAVSSLVNGTHLISHDGGSVEHFDDTGINLTDCDDGTDIGTCPTNVFRRYLLGLEGWGANTLIHQFAPSTSDETYNTLGECMNIGASPLVFNNLPASEEYAFAKRYAYCGKRDDAAWRVGWILINGGGGISGAIDTSNFLLRDGTVPLTANWPLGAYSLTGGVWSNFTNAAFTNLYVDTLGSKGGAGITLADDVSGGNYSLNDVGEFNKELIVQSGNATDINSTIGECVFPCTVRIPNGNYYNVSFNITSGLHVKCDSGARLYSYRNSQIMSVYSSETHIQNFTLSGCWFDADGDNWDSNFEDNPIELRVNISNSDFYDNTFVNSYERPFLVVGDKDTLKAATNVKIYDNDFLDVESGIAVSYGIECSVHHNYLKSRTTTSGGSEYGEGIEVNYGLRNKVDDNILIEFQENGIDANYDYGTVCRNLIVGSDNTRVTTHIDKGSCNNTIISENIILNINGLDIGIDVEGDYNYIFDNVLSGNGAGTGLEITGKYNDYYDNKYSQLTTDIIDTGITNLHEVGNSYFDGSFISSGNHLVFYSPFEIGSGTIAYDTEGTTGSLEGNAAWISGMFGSAIYLDGVNDYVNFGNNDNWNFGNFTDFSVEGWINMSASGAPQIILSYTNTTSSDPRWYFRLSNLDKLNFVFDDGDEIKSLTGETVLQENINYHVAFTADRDGDAKLYLNGKLEDTEDITSIDNLTSLDNNLKFGVRNVATDDFEGIIDEFKIYDAVLSWQNIQAAYLLGISGHSPDGHLLSQSDILVNTTAIYPQNNLDFLGSYGISNIASLTATANLDIGEKFYFGDNDESYMYENGSALIIGRH